MHPEYVEEELGADESSELGDAPFRLQPVRRVYFFVSNFVSSRGMHPYVFQ